MISPDPVDVQIEIDVIRSFSTLESARSAADPRESPVALIVHDDTPVGTRFLDAIGRVSFARPERTTLSCAWVPRARLLRALEQIEPLEAIRLGRMPPTDGLLWTVVHVARSCRVAEHGKRGPVTRAAENAMIGAVYTRCGYTRCVDDADHDWEVREVSGEDGQSVDDTTCTRCGMPEDVYVTWSAWGFER